MEFDEHFRTQSLDPKDIFDFIGDGERVYTEGRRLFNSNHIMMIGITKVNAPKIEVFAIVLSATKPTEKIPKKVVVVIVQKNEHGDLFYTIGTTQCSCKAGSNKCKHVYAVLLKLSRTLDLEMLSCTDMAQQWGKLKNSVAEKYAPKPLNDDACHFKKAKTPYGEEDLRPDDKKFDKLMFNMFLEAAPCSEFALFWNGPANPRTKQQNLNLRETTLALPELGCSLSPEPKNGSPPPPFSLPSNMSNVPSAPKINHQQEAHDFFIDLLERTPCYENDHILFELNLSFLTVELAEFYEKFVKVTPHRSLEICLLTLFQDNPSWFYERRLRIGGSIGYSLYTYSKNANPDWEKKIRNLLFPKFKGNAATKHGQDCEQKAREAYERVMFCHIIRLGSIICPNACWLSYSADGICKINGIPILIEIKSPVLGQTLTSSELVEKCSFLEKIGNGFKLRKKHAYYGQVQLGMQLLRVNICHLIIYASVDESIAIIEVEKDEEFLSEYIPVLSHVYYEQILPRLVLAKQQEKLKM